MDENDSKQASEDGLGDSTGTPVTDEVDVPQEQRVTDAAENNEPEGEAEGGDEEEEEEAEESDDVRLSVLPLISI